MKFDGKTFIFFMSLSLILLSIFNLQNILSINAITLSSTDKTIEKKDLTEIVLKIDGIDYSIKKALVFIITNNDKVISKLINPIKLLNPDDDNNGLIQVPMQFEKGLLKTGDKYVSCIKVLEDTDKFGNNVACQQGIFNSNNDREQLSSAEKRLKENDRTLEKDNGNTEIKLSL